jgi:HlyD family secretion protein
VGDTVGSSSNNSNNNSNNSTTTTTTTATLGDLFIATTTQSSSSSSNSSSAVISIANLNEPQVQVNIDETDLADFAVGCSAQVTFDSLPNQTFNGKVSSISPTLVSVQNVDQAQGLIDLENAKAADGKFLPLGLTGTVEVTCQQAANALLVPTSAVYTPTGAQPYVYVLNAQGQPEKREITLGVSSVASTQVLSGLSEGERVITSPVK